MTRGTKLLIVLAIVISVLTPVAVSFSVYAFYRVGDQVDRVDRLTAENRRLIDQVAKFAVTIQLQRRTSILESCQDVNRRHDRFVRALDSLPISQRGRSSTLFLVETFLPRTDCQKRVRRLAPITGVKR